MPGRNVYTIPAIELLDWLLAYTLRLAIEIREMRPDRELALASFIAGLQEVETIDELLRRMSTESKPPTVVANEALQAPTDMRVGTPDFTDELTLSLDRATRALIAAIYGAMKELDDGSHLKTLLSYFLYAFRDLWRLGARARMEAVALEQGVAPGIFKPTDVASFKPNTIVGHRPFSELATPSPAQIRAQAAAAEEWILEVVDGPVLETARA